MVADQELLPNMHDSSTFWIEYIARHASVKQWTRPRWHSLNHITAFHLDTFSIVLLALFVAVKILR